MTASASIPRCVAFDGLRLIAAGPVPDAAAAAKRAIDSGDATQVVVFDEVTSEVIEIDWRGSEDDVRVRIQAALTGGASQSAPDAPRGPGRPKLGVVAREVTLLPKHWEWLGSQPGGASVALRKLVEAASRDHVDVDRKRRAQDAAYRFMTTMAGDLPGYEEALRAFFKGDAAAFKTQTTNWPKDVRDHARALASAAL
ncbi:hypothetical protein Pan44_24860 [Caulifigura coniformis]|uniref:DUF2239 domain-containing protein n=1 Tax=Caulifigura coniformis TaxID=2527983 RepID=A0A517SE99_9PLAN|nr:DUF2239 family protein [Caulifigura coniformis]QDT54453.1 hypothetical protein Pan44_24860 [Caulifigura coniformis]